MQAKQQLRNLIEFANTRLYRQVEAWRVLPPRDVEMSLQLLETYGWLELGVKLGLFPRTEATDVAIETFYPTFAGFDVCSGFLPLQMKLHFDSVRRTKAFFNQAQELEFHVQPDAESEANIVFQVLLQLSTKLVGNTYFDIFHLMSSRNVDQWTRVIDKSSIHDRLTDHHVLKTLDISLKPGRASHSSHEEWWNVIRGYCVALEYIAEQREVLTQLQGSPSEGTSALYLPLLRRVEFMERWKMDFRGSQLFSQHFDELTDIVADAKALEYSASDISGYQVQENFKSYVKALRTFWTERGSRASLGAGA